MNVALLQVWNVIRAIKIFDGLELTLCGCDKFGILDGGRIFYGNTYYQKNLTR
jgi:hypothetical protein